MLGLGRAERPQALDMRDGRLVVTLRERCGAGILAGFSGV